MILVRHNHHLQPAMSDAEPSSSKPHSSARSAQAAQLEKLLKDPNKPAYIPSGPKEKGIRPPQDMIKNVMGSSAGAGSGEFHIYKHSRRREFERLKLMEEEEAKVGLVAVSRPQQTWGLME